MLRAAAGARNPSTPPAGFGGSTPVSCLSRSPVHRATPTAFRAQLLSDLLGPTEWEIKVSSWAISWAPQTAWLH